MNEELIKECLLSTEEISSIIWGDSKLHNTSTGFVGCEIAKAQLEKAIPIIAEEIFEAIEHLKQKAYAYTLSWNEMGLASHIKNSWPEYQELKAKYLK